MKNLSAGKDDVTHPSHIPERTREKRSSNVNQGKNETELSFYEAAIQLSQDFPAIAVTTRHSPITFKVLGSGDHLYPGAQTPFSFSIPAFLLTLKFEFHSIPLCFP